MSFGFSLGDIIAVVSLSFNTCINIRESPAAHMDLATQLEIFRGSLESFRQSITDLELLPSTSEPVGKQLSKCWQLLQELDGKNKRYMEKSLSGDGEYKRRKDVVRELQWGLYRRNRLEKSVDNLGSQISCLYSFLHAYNTRMTQESNIVLANMQKILPSLNGCPDMESIRFIDALDREMPFPLHMCETWKGFHELLKLSFRDSVGNSWVEAGRFEILDESNGAALTANGWNVAIRPGMTLSMAMLIRKHKDANTTEHNCPSCNFSYTGTETENLKRVRCKRCATWFQISSEDRIQELRDDDPGVSVLDDSNTDTQMIRLEGSGGLFDAEEVKHFRRLHVVLKNLEQSQGITEAEELRPSLPPRLPRSLSYDDYTAETRKVGGGRG